MQGMYDYLKDFIIKKNPKKPQTKPNHQQQQKKQNRKTSLQVVQAWC